MRFILILLPLLNASIAFAGTPDCKDPDSWPAAMAHVHLKNSGLIKADNSDVDFTKTKVRRIASEKIGKDLYRQVHLVTFFRKSGELLQAITVNEVSNEECSMSGVDVFTINTKYGDYTKEIELHNKTEHLSRPIK